jgi:hypothetical protein
MRKLLFVMVLLVVGVVALGFYREWFIVETTSDSQSGRQGVQFEVDRKKMDPDINKVKEKISGSTQAGQKEDKQQQ